MASAGITDEIQELFQSVADDLGWLNIDGEVQGGPNQITTYNSNKTTQRKTKKKQKSGESKKVSTQRKKKTKGTDGNVKSTKGHSKKQDRGSDNEQREGNATKATIEFDKHLKDDTNRSNDDCNTLCANPAIVIKDNGEDSSVSSNCKKVTDMMLSLEIKVTVKKHEEVEVSSNSQGTNQQTVHPILSIDCDKTKTCSPKADKDGQISPWDYIPSPVLNHSPVSDSEKTEQQFNGDQNSDSEPEALLTERKNGSCNGVNQSDSEPEAPLSLTERLMQNHKSTKKDKKPLSVRRKENNVTSKRVPGSVIDLTNSQSENEENICPEYNSSFKSYRDVKTPAKVYASDSSSDDDDKFEDFLASIKSSQTPVKKPPSREEMDDFIDDEPIVISSTDEEEEADQDDGEVFYYQCNNADTPLFQDEAESSNSSSVYKSILSESTASDYFITPATHPKETSKPVFKKPAGNSNHPSPAIDSSVSDTDNFITPATHPKGLSKPVFKTPAVATSHPSPAIDSSASDTDNFVTPASHLYATYNPIFKRPANKKASPVVTSLLSDSDSEDEFKTPRWEPSHSQKKGLQVTDNWRAISDTKVPIKSKPLSTMVTGLRSSESEGDDHLFATPAVRPPLKTKKPPNTLPTKPVRPLSNFNKPSQVHGIRSAPSFLLSLATPFKGESASSPYVNNFKKKKEELTIRLFKIYNKTVFDEKLPLDMSITWNKRLRKTAGYCYYSKSKVGENRSSRIELSDKVCDTAERLRDTLIHELCHAAAWLINGVHDGHGRYWKYWAAKANIAHPEIPVIKRCHSYEITTKYKYQCTRCSTTIGRHSKSINVKTHCCAYCKGQLVLLPTTNKDGTPSKARQPSKFALFVKENYASAKKDNAQMKHADIMRLLGRDFAGKAKISE